MIGTCITKTIFKKSGNPPEIKTTIRKFKLEKNMKDIELTDAEIDDIMANLDELPDEEVEYMGDEELDDEDIEEDEFDPEAEDIDDDI
mgnify:CR=1 FL=1